MEIRPRPDIHRRQIGNLFHLGGDHLRFAGTIKGIQFQQGIYQPGGFSCGRHALPCAIFRHIDIGDGAADSMP